MLGVILISIGTFFGEIADSIGKNKVASRKESPYTMAFLSVFWGAIFFLFICLIKNNAFIFNLDSLPTFLTRAILEIAQLYVQTFAVIYADRSTFNFIRTITIPLLLLVDYVLGYKLGILPMAGTTLIAITLFITFLNGGIKKNGSGYVLFSAVNAVITISLYKYDITHFNSVVAEQLLINLILLVSFSYLALVKAKENPFKFLTKPVFFFQSAANGLGGVIESYAYGYGAASIIAAAKRASAIFWSIMSGKMYFKEKKITFKLIIFLILLLCLIMLAFN